APTTRVVWGGNALNSGWGGEPVDADHGEADQEGDELWVDLGAERLRAVPHPAHVADVERGREQGQRERAGRVDEADGAVELRLVAGPAWARGHRGNLSGRVGPAPVSRPGSSPSGWAGLTVAACYSFVHV